MPLVPGRASGRLKNPPLPNTLTYVNRGKWRSPVRNVGPTLDKEEYNVFATRYTRIKESLHKDINQRAKNVLNGPITRNDPKMNE